MNFIKHILLLCIGSLIFVSGCDLPGLGGSQTNKSVKISALATSESQIMAYMLKDLIEHDTKGKIQGSIINNLGSATIQHNALLKGDADISSTRYTGTDLTGVLKQKPITDSKKAMHITQTVSTKNSIKRSLILMVLKIHSLLWLPKRQHKNIIYIKYQI